MLVAAAPGWGYAGALKAATALPSLALRRQRRRGSLVHGRAPAVFTLPSAHLTAAAVSVAGRGGGGGGGQATIPADTGRSTLSAYRQRWIEDDEMVKFRENSEVRAAAAAAGPPPPHGGHASAAAAATCAGRLSGAAVRDYVAAEDCSGAAAEGMRG